MKNPLVSIIIPIYNAEKSIVQCFESCLAQSYKDLEIIAINDCSTDNSGTICDQYADRYSNFTVIHNEVNKGPQQARPSGIQRSAGDFIYFLDADDFIPNEEAIALLVEAQKANRADIVIGGYDIAKGASIQKIIPAPFNTHDPLEALIFFFRKPYRTLWAKLYRKGLFKDVTVPTHIHHGEDLILNTQIFSKADISITTIPDSIYRYELIESSITHNLSFKNALNVLDAELWMYDYLSAKNLLANKQLYNTLCIHAIPKLIAAVNLKGKSAFNRPYFKRLYTVFYKKCTKQSRSQFALHNRLLIILENVSPTLSSAYNVLLRKAIQLSGKS